jgi:hypothetical protein
MGTKWGQGRKASCVICGVIFNVQGRRKACSTKCSAVLRERPRPVYKNKRTRVDKLYISGGYVVLSGPSVEGHPAQRGTHRHVLHHIFVAYAAHGEGPHSCHWCQRPIDWFFKRRKGTDGVGKICVDHLNWVKIDNRTENLVLSCMQCNVDRSSHGMTRWECSRIACDITRKKRARCTGCDREWNNYNGYAGHRIKCREGTIEYLDT